MSTMLTRPQAVALARDMWDGGDGWTITEIREYIADRGQRVAWPTVKHWVDEDWHVRRLARRRELERSADAGPTTPELLWTMRVEDRLSYATIAKVATRFLDEPMTEAQARQRLYELGAPKNPNKVRMATVDNPSQRQAA